MKTFTMRDACRGDLETIQAIDNKCTYLCLSERQIFDTLANIQVAECDDQVIGFWRADMVNNHVKVSKLCVLPAWRRQGIGTIILLDLFETAAAFEAKSINFLIPESSFPAQIFLRDNGFACTRIFPDSFDMPDPEDGYLFRRILHVSEPGPRDNRTTRQRADHRDRFSGGRSEESAD